MKLLRLIDFLQKRSRKLARICLVVLALLVVVDAIPGLVDKHHAHTAVERFPAFWAVFGFVGCVVLILLSKAFGHAGIMKREDYYND
jgi:cytochrome bd-type quinol oxidase subunit 2